MAKQLPDYHSPLMALGKKVLFWIVLPAALVLSLFYGLDTSRYPTEQELAIQKAFEDGTAAERESTAKGEARKKELAAAPGAVKATPEQLSEARQTQAGRDALARNQYADPEVQKRLAALNEKASARPTADGYVDLTPRHMVDHVLQGHTTGSGYDALRIVPTRAGATIPQGTVVKDEAGKEVAKCDKAACTELNISTLPEDMKEGRLKIRDASGTLKGVIPVGKEGLKIIKGTIPPS